MNDTVRNPRKLLGNGMGSGHGKGLLLLRVPGEIREPIGTPPKTDMELKNWWFVDVFPFPTSIFWFHVSFRGCITPTSS